MAVPRVKVRGGDLAEVMIAHKVTPGMVGLKANCSAALVRMLRSGQRTHTKLSTAQRIAAAIGCEVRAFAEPDALSDREITALANTSPDGRTWHVDTKGQNDDQ